MEGFSLGQAEGGEEIGAFVEFFGRAGMVEEVGHQGLDSRVSRARLRGMPQR
jgi:hypothetical protein